MHGQVLQCPSIVELPIGNLLWIFNIVVLCWRTASSLLYLVLGKVDDCLLFMFLMSLIFNWTATPDAGEDPKVTRAKFFIRDEFLVSNFGLMCDSIIGNTGRWCSLFRENWWGFAESKRRGECLAILWLFSAVHLAVLAHFDAQFYMKSPALHSVTASAGAESGCVTSCLFPGSV